MFLWLQLLYLYVSMVTGGVPDVVAVVPRRYVLHTHRRGAHCRHF